MFVRLSVILFALTLLQQAAATAGDNHVDGQSTTAWSDDDQIVNSQLNIITSTYRSDK